MFDKKSKEQQYTENLGKTNRIVEGTIIKGNIISQADFRLDGQLIGNFESSGKIVIGPSGVLLGDISCKSADIEGKFTGKIEADEILNVKSQAIVDGQVIVGKLAVEPGANFTATCLMKNNTKANATSDAKPKA